MPGSPVTIVWFRQDLRLTDHPALDWAAERGAVVPVFIWAPEEEAPWAPGAASRWFLHQALNRLSTKLLRAGSQLIIRRGATRVVLENLIAETGASAVAWTERYEPESRERDERVRVKLTERGIEARAFPGSLLHEPGAVLTAQGKPYQVFTPFWKSCLARENFAAPLPEPTKLRGPARWPAGESIDALGLLPTISWDSGLSATWPARDSAPRDSLAHFVEHGLAEYATNRNRPDVDGVSRWSPYLHFGEISPRQAWKAVGEWLAAKKRTTDEKHSAETLRAELGWREFAHDLMHHFPHTPQSPLRPAFAAFPWHDDDDSLRAWQRGRTGYPMIDAGMRQLWATGWMHNRVRMMVASFLVKDLLLSWQQGAAWFWDTLVDADLANNTLGWQWTAGCGADAAPYFRVFNPVSQGKKFDPGGAYVRRWVPELARLDDEWIHRPWEAPPLELSAAGVVLGKNYPRRIVDHAEARRRALAALATIRTS